MAKCEGKNKKSGRCGSNALPRSKYCGAHQAQSQREANRIGFFRKHWKVLLEIIGIILAVISLIYYFKDSAIKTMIGNLKPQGIASIKYVSIGASRFKVDSPDGVLFTDGNLPLLSFRISNNKLLVSTIIRDNFGEIIAELTDNEWQINQGKTFDRNYTEKILEVRNNAGKIALQAVHFGDTVHLAGIFRCKNGQTTVIGPIDKDSSVMDVRPPGIENQYEIPLVCEYGYPFKPGQFEYDKCYSTGSQSFGYLKPSWHMVSRLR